MNLISKIIIVLLVFIIIFNSSAGFLKPKKAETVWWSTFPQQIVQQAVDVAHYARVAYQWLEDKLGKTLRDAVAKRIIDYIVDQTIVWIQGGGQPKFVTDWQGFLKDVGDIAFDQVIKDVGLAFLCAPFKFQVQLSLLPVQRFQQRIDCTLDDVVKNIEDFYRDFENGGWIAYNEAWQPQNNYYGQMIMIHDEILARTTEQTEAAKNEGLAGGGFLSPKRCVEPEYTMEEKTISEPVCSQVDPETGECVSYETETRIEYSPVQTGCKKEEIVTPGSMVGAAVASGITSDIQWAANIQSWSSALINAVINRVIKEGVGALKGSGESGGGSYYPPEYQSSVDLEVETERQQQITEVKKFVNEWQYLFNTESKSLSYAEQIKVILAKIKELNCQPAVSDSEIQAVQADIDRLKTETADLKNKIDEGNNVITEITNANTIRERTIAQQDFLAFMDKYNTQEIQEQIIAGDAYSNAANQDFATAAVQELATKTNDLSIAQGRLNTCPATRPTP